MMPIFRHDGEGDGLKELIALLARPLGVRRKDTGSITNMQRSKGSVLERKR